MHIVILALLVVALALLVLALIGANSALAVCSLAFSLIAVAVILRGRQHRAELARLRQAEAARLAELDAQTRVLAAAAAEAGRRAAAAPTRPVAEPVMAGESAAVATVPAEPAPVGSTLTDEPAPAGSSSADEPAPAGSSSADEPAPAETVAPLERHGQARVWVIDGRPRYHLTECRRLDGSAEPISLAQAVGDGFTPCAECDPDNRITG